MRQDLGTFKGYAISLLCISYDCPSLKLYGYATERQLKNAITRKLNKTSKR